MYELVVLASYSAGILVLSAITLGLFSELYGKNGSAGFVVAEGLTLFIATAVSVPFSFFVLKDAIIWEFALVGFLNSAALTYVVSYFRNKDAEAAPAIVEFALANFDKLDKNGDGNYVRGDVYACIESGKFSDADVNMLYRLMYRTESIGHVYDWMIVASYPPPSPAIGLYAVNRKDLAAYKQRMSLRGGGLFH